MTVYTIKKNVGTNIVAREQCGSTIHKEVVVGLHNAELGINIAHRLSDTCGVCQINALAIHR